MNSVSLQVEQLRQICRSALASFGRIGLPASVVDDEELAKLPYHERWADLVSNGIDVLLREVTEEPDAQAWARAMRAAALGPVEGN